MQAWIRALDGLRERTLEQLEPEERKLLAARFMDELFQQSQTAIAEERRPPLVGHHGSLGMVVMKALHASSYSHSCLSLDMSFQSIGMLKGLHSALADRLGLGGTLMEDGFYKKHHHTLQALLLRHCK